MKCCFEDINLSAGIWTDSVLTPVGTTILILLALPSTGAGAASTAVCPKRNHFDIKPEAGACLQQRTGFIRLDNNLIIMSFTRGFCEQS
jgi:hypothetical protein